MAAAEWLYGQSPRDGGEGGRPPPDVVHQFHECQTHSFGGTYVELLPHERIRYTDKFDDPNLVGEIEVTITLKEVSCGTELHIVQEGVPDVIPAEMCYLGWQESLISLASLVEADIPG